MRSGEVIRMIKGPAGERRHRSPGGLLLQWQDALIKGSQTNSICSSGSYYRQIWCAKAPDMLRAVGHFLIRRPYLSGEYSAGQK